MIEMHNIYPCNFKKWCLSFLDYLFFCLIFYSSVWTCSYGQFLYQLIIYLLLLFIIIYLFF